MTTRKPKPSAEPATPSPIGAMILRAAHLMERTHRLNLMDLADIGCKWDRDRWDRGLSDEYFILENAILHSEPTTIGDALAMLLLATCKLDTLISNLQPTPGSDDAESDEYQLARLIEGALRSVCARLLGDHAGQLPAGTAGIFNLPAMSSNRHGPALVALPSEAELEAARAMRYAAPDAAEAQKGSAQ